MERFSEKVKSILKTQRLILDDNDCDTLNRFFEWAQNIEDAEEQGRLVVLPCKVGDIVYNIIPERGIISTLAITAIKIYKSGLFFEWTLIDGIYKYMSGFEDFELNKTVFLTREAAEAALAANNDSTGG